MSDHLGTREIQHFIDGRYTASISRQSLAERSSLNSLPIARVAEGGREGGVHSLEFYTELRNVCIKL